VFWLVHDGTKSPVASIRYSAPSLEWAELVHLTVAVEVACAIVTLTLVCLQRLHSANNIAINWMEGTATKALAE